MTKGREVSLVDQHVPETLSGLSCDVLFWNCTLKIKKHLLTPSGVNKF